MLTTPKLEKIRTEIEQFFKKMGFEIKIEDLSPKEEVLKVSIRVEDPQLLIGEGGQTLLEIQYLLRSILRKKLEEFFYLDLDINQYKEKKIIYLKELARSLADEVALTKKEKVLEPMPAYQRRIVHLELAERPDVTTESIGQEPDRKVVIRPYP
jgi:spoIIIJ-associated protein